MTNKNQRLKPHKTLEKKTNIRQQHLFAHQNTLSAEHVDLRLVSEFSGEFIEIRIADVVAVVVVITVVVICVITFTYLVANNGWI